MEELKKSDMADRLLVHNIKLMTAPPLSEWNGQALSCLLSTSIQSDLSKELFAVLKGTLIPVQRGPVERINRVTRKNHQGVIAVSYTHLYRIMRVLKSSISASAAVSR